MKRFVRKRVFLGFIIALLGLTVGVSVALAKSGPGQVSAPLSSDPTFECPAPTGHSYGKATLIREKGVMTARVKLHGAAPGKYTLEIATEVAPGLCLTIGGLPLVVDTFKVDSSGDGEGGGTFDMSDFQRFVLFVVREDFTVVYGTPIMKVGSS